ncbi:response regulator [Agaribacterium haliotis]|uniref:response regulator n=1 Tax=Agaribacterium haliotis TaxID=2013869 RepID=UPI000BB536FD|nr:response regulator [Agaribacterium haliotis]
MATAKEARSDSTLWQLSSTAVGMIIIAVFAIASVFFLLHQQRLEDMLARSIQLNEILLDREPQTSAPSASDIAQDLEQRAHSLLAIDDFIALTLVNERGDKLFERGLPVDKNDIGLRFISETSWQHQQQLHLSQAWHNADGKPTWLITTIDKTGLSLLNLQYLFLLCLIALGITVFAMLYHRKLLQDIFEPLQDLLESLDKNNRTREISPLNLNRPGIFAGLLQRLNANIAIQVENEMELRQNIENASMELRESLETVEIQNIDLDLARKNAVEMNRLKSEFLKKTSQDLRTPLSGILGFSELLQKTALSSDQRDYINTIEESTKGMLTIVSDIHDFSRLESGKLQVENKAMDLRQCIEETLRLQAHFAGERGIKLYSLFDDEIPQTLHSDPIRIQQVVANLISNTLKFERCSFVEIYAEQLSSDDSSVELRVNIRCDGELPQELESWHRDEIETQVYSGARIGLSIAKGIAEHMQGKIDLLEQDELSGFSVELKLGVEQADHVPSKYIDANFQVHALVFSSNDRAYREIASRLGELNINQWRARSFSDILTQAKRLRDEAIKHARYLPLAVIEAQTSRQTLDKILLQQTVKSLHDELQIPTVVIAPMGQYEAVQKILSNHDSFIAQHPLQSARLRRGLLDQLGVVRLNKGLSANASSASTSMQLLLVEDNAANAKIARAMLQDFNATVDLARSGSEAIERCQKQQYDLVFMDIQLPDFDGFETTLRIRRHEAGERRTPIVALTARDIKEERSKLLLAGMDDFLSKPLNSKALGRIIDRWVVSAKSKSAAPLQRPAPQTLNALNNSSSENQDADNAELVLSPVNISASLKLAKNDKSLAHDMLKMLIESLEKEAPVMLKACENNDIDKLYELVHRLHGACCYCGVPQLQPLTKKLDEQLNIKRSYEQADMDKLFKHIDELLQWSSEHDLSALFSPAD